MRSDDPRFLSRFGRVLPGVKRLISVPAPAAGTEWSVTVPGGRQWRVVSGFYAITTSATVANRNPGIQMSVDGAMVYVQVDATNLAAGSTARYSVLAMEDAQRYNAAAGFGMFALPDAYMIPGTQIGSDTQGLQAGDTYSAVSLYIEEVYADDQQLTEHHLAREEAEREALAAGGVILRR